MKNGCILLLCFLCFSATSQTDTIYGSLSEVESYNGSNSLQIIEADNSYYVFMLNYGFGGSKLSVHKTDRFFLEKKNTSIFPIDGMSINNVFHVHSNEDEIICLIMSSDSDNVKIISLGVPFDLDAIEIKSEIILSEASEFVNFYQFGYDESKEVFHSVGYTSDGINEQNVLIELDLQGEIVTLEELETDKVRINLATTKFNDNFFISAFADLTSSLVNRKLETVYSEKNFISFSENNISYNGEVVLHDCFSNNGSIDCIGRTFPITSYGLTLMNFSLMGSDSFVANYFLPLLNIPDRLSTAKTIEDEDYYYYVGTGENNPFNSTVDPNILHISKMNKTYPYDVEWSLHFENGEEHLVSDISRDEEGSLLVVGSTLGNQNDSGRKNFYLKVFGDGTLVSTINPIDSPIIKLYPNPNSGVFILEGNNTGLGEMEIFDVFGRKVFETTLTNKTERISMTLPSGTYFVKVRNNRTQQSILKMTVQ